MRRLRDFRCSTCDHVHERLADDTIHAVACPECAGVSKRIISPVRAKLDFTFPGEAIKWAKKHEEGAKQNSAQ